MSPKINNNLPQDKDTRIAQLEQALAIEAALERVRAASMAMHKSEELAKVITVVYNQLKVLGIDFFQAYMTILYLEKGNQDVWASPIEGIVDTPFYFKTPTAPWENTNIKDWKEGKEFSYISIQGKEALHQYLQQLEELSGKSYFKKFKEIQFFENLEATEANHKYGRFGLSQFVKATAEEKAILKRFAKVFEQAYTRFLDLQKAEAQAREAQIEASLERIRAASMAMHHSDELTQVCQVFLSQIEQLAIPLLGVSIAMMNEDTRNIMQYVVDNTKKSQEPSLFSFEYNIDEFSIAAEYIELAKKGNTEFSMPLGKKRIAEWIAWVGKFMGAERAERLKKANLEKIYFHMLTFHGWSSCVNFSSLEELSAEHWSVMRRLVNTFAMSYRRFLDLQKAEAQAREAQIEAALERVRAASMAMHKSKELPNVALAILKEANYLDIAKAGCAIGIFDMEERTVHSYGANMVAGEIVLGKVLNHSIDSFWVLQECVRRIDIGDSPITIELKDKHLQEVADFLNYEEEAGASFHLENKSIYYNLVPFYEYSVISISSLQPLLESEFEILKRMARTLRMSYIRFLDLQKAEAQAKEAQIEAALERVRAASMAMHKSKDLGKVIQEVMHQMEQLGVLVDSACIHVFKEGTKDFGIWVATTPENSYPVEIYVPYIKHITMDRLHQSIAQKEKLLVLSLTKAQKDAIYQHMFENTKLGELINEERRKMLLSAPSMELSFGISENTAISLNNFSNHVYTLEENNNLQRFTKVFEQTYTRFLDLQKAEAQAREAQIEAALERVRAASMAMHKTNQLIDVTTTLFGELKVLELEVIAAWIVLIDIKKESLEVWVTGFDKQFPETINFGGDYNAIPEFKEVVNKWSRGDEFAELDFVGNQAVQLYLDDLIAFTGIQHFNTFRNNEYLLSLDAFHKYGTLGMGGSTTYTAHQKHVLKRFSIVFEQAYTRFLDIQKAEAQAKEAQIEAALERVRAASMAMHKTSQITDVTMTLFEELKVFDLEVILALITLINRENKSFETWIIGFDKEFPDAFNFRADYNNANPQLKENFDTWLRGEEFIVYNIQGNQAVQLFLGELITLTDIQSFNKFRSLDNIHSIENCNKYGTLGMVATSEFAAHQKHVLKRFSIVFEQAYTRFLDIQKAEAQAREAQIEAALEKVRAKTASMYKSTELEAVVSLVFQQLRLLDFDSKQCIIGIIDKETLETETWQSVDAQSGLPNSYKIPKLNHPFIQEGYDAYLNGEQYHERELSGAAKKSYDKLIFEQTDLRNVPAEVKAAIIQNEKIVTGSAYMSHGVIQVIGAAALSAEKAHILQRFAAAIDLTYTRFLDIQKAEQQKIQLEKVFSENQRLLHSILPAPIAEQIRQGQQTVVKRFEQVSILFADIVGFTVLSDRISPQEVVDILNGLFSKFDDLTDKYGLEKIKTIGDAYMVAAGVPEEKDNHAQLMFAFAKDMLQTLQGYNQVIGTDLKIRIGISSGPVVAGVIGKKKFAYDLWGDTVNTAARMEAYGHADCIQVSPTTYAILKKEATFEKIPNVAIKGKGTMDVYLWKE